MNLHSDKTTRITTASNVAAPTQFVEANGETYAYRRFGAGPGRPLLFLQHFMGTLDNWDYAVTDSLASGREVILFDNAGIGRSSGKVPQTVAGMAKHALAFLDGLGVSNCDVLGFSLGGMVALQMVQDRPAIFRKMILVGTAPRGGEDIMHLEKPNLGRYLQDPTLRGYAVLQKIFFAPTESSQTAGEGFVRRLTERKDDLDPPSGAEVAANQVAAFREWEQFVGQRFADLRDIRQPTLVVNGVHDEMIPVSNSYRLTENLPNAALLVYPDAGHGSLFQYHESFVRQATAFLDSTEDSMQTPDDTARSILAPHTAAPDFTLMSSPDRPITLSNLRGRPVILAFYPADWSPVCGDQMALYNEILPEFRKLGAELLGISVDSAWCHRAFAENRRLRFPLLPDFEPKGQVARRYGVYRAGDGTSERALFVIDAKGMIRWSHLSPIDLNPGADGILQALEDISE